MNKHPMTVALESNKPSDWAEFRDYMRDRLTPDQRYMLTYAAYQSCNEADQDELLSDFAWRGDAPSPPLAANMTAAREWASMASGDELKAYAASSFEYMSERLRKRFVEWMREEVSS